MHCSDRIKKQLELLYEIESYLRVVARWELRGHLGRGWKSGLDQDALAGARQRMKQEAEHGCLDAYRNAHLSYLTLAELKDIFLGPLWSKAIQRHWPQKSILKSEFNKLIAARNKAAHFRPLTLRDSRIVTRFAEDLQEWTAHYTRMSEYSERVPWQLFAEGSDKRIDDLGLKDDTIFDTVHDCVDSVEFIGHHSVIIFRLQAAPQPEAVLRLADAMGDALTLVASMPDSNEVRVSIPSDGLGNLLPRVLAEGKALANFSEEELVPGVEQKAGELVHESVLPPSTKFPMAFQLTRT